MAEITYVDVIPSLIENTSMQQRLNDGVPVTYRITPNEGYVLHDNILDEENDGELVLGYRTSTASCSVNYDFTTNPREFYAVLASEVPEDRIFGIVGPKPEVM